jgi:hypothetical protein
MYKILIFLNRKMWNIGEMMAKIRKEEFWRR